MLCEHAAQLFWWCSVVFCGYRWQKLDLPDSNLEVFNRTNYNFCYNFVYNEWDICDSPFSMLQIIVLIIEITIGMI